MNLKKTVYEQRTNQNSPSSRPAYTDEEPSPKPLESRGAEHNKCLCTCCLLAQLDCEGNPELLKLRKRPSTGGARRSKSRPVRKEITFSYREWEKSQELFRKIKGCCGYSTYMNFARDMLIHGNVPTLYEPADPARLHPDIVRIDRDINRMVHTDNAAGAFTSEQYAALVQSVDSIWLILNDLQHMFAAAVTDGWQRWLLSEAKNVKTVLD